jgi:hypothetical protein
MSRGCARQESAFLLSSSMVLVLGMVFASQGFPPGSMSYNALVVLTAALVVGSAGAFIVLLVFEVFRSVKVLVGSTGAVAARCSTFDGSVIALLVLGEVATCQCSPDLWRYV